MLITCPACEASYDIKTEALGDKGRTVRCASCGTKWFAAPEAPAESAEKEPDFASLLGEEEEAADPWDEALAEDAAIREKALAEPASAARAEDLSGAEPEGSRAPDAANEAQANPDGGDAAQKPPILTVEAAARGPFRRGKAQTASTRKKKPGTRQGSDQTAIDGGLIALCFLIIALGLGVTFRNDLVRIEPGFATVFNALRMPVNIRGLEFSRLDSKIEVENAQPVAIITGEIRNLTKSTLALPKLRISVRDAAGAEVYATAAASPRPLIGPGETIPFQSRLTVLPKDGNDIEVRFLDARDTRAKDHS